MSAQCWDVVRVDFPYAAEPISRPRPTLVIATPAATPPFGMVWVLMIARARHASWPEDVSISDLASTGLLRPSLIRTAKIAAIGHRSDLDRRAVAACLKCQLRAALSP